MTALSNIYLSQQYSSAAQPLCHGQLAASLSHRIVLFSLCWAIISIFYHFIQFLETAAGGEVDRTLIFISSFHLFADLAKHPAGQLRSSPAACLPSLSAPPPPFLLPWRPSRVGWTHRKTKTKNILSCSISFTDE